MVQIYLLRHGSTGPEYSGRYIGKSDVPLHPSGYDAVDFWKKKLPEFDAVFCSPLLRTRQTAERIGISYRIVSELQEMNFGDCEEKSFDELQREMPTVAQSLLEANTDFSFPNGESSEQLKSRVNHFIQQTISPIAQKYDPPRSRKSILLITHAGIIRQFLISLLGFSRQQTWRFQLDLASLSRLDYTPTYTSLAFWNRSLQWEKSI